MLWTLVPVSGCFLGVLAWVFIRKRANPATVTPPVTNVGDNSVAKVIPTINQIQKDNTPPTGNTKVDSLTISYSGPIDPSEAAQIIAKPGQGQTGGGAGGGGSGGGGVGGGGGGKTTPPTVVSIIANTSSSIDITFSNTLQGSSVPVSDFILIKNGVTQTIGSAVISGSAVRLNLLTTFFNNDVITIQYLSSTDIVDVTNGVAAPFGPSAATLTQGIVPPITDTTPPSVVQLSGNTPTTITILFSEALDVAHVPAANTFAVLKNGSSYTVQSTAISGSNVILTFATQFLNTDTLTVQYTGTAIRDAAGNQTANFGPLAVATPGGANASLKTRHGGHWGTLQGVNYTTLPNNTDILTVKNSDRKSVV